MILKNQVETAILDAAEKVFYLKGKDGTSMQDIADEAKITRTSLNYYYRSKDKLFEAVFLKTLSHFVPKIAELMNAEATISEYLPEMIEVIIDTMIERPQIPVFVLQELTSNPDRVPQLMQELGIHPSESVKNMGKDQALQSLPFDPRHIIINVMSMCIFPFAGKPILVSIMFNGNEEAYIEAMKQRKKLLPKMIENMIKSYKA